MSFHVPVTVSGCDPRFLQYAQLGMGYLDYPIIERPDQQRLDWVIVGELPADLVPLAREYYKLEEGGDKIRFRRFSFGVEQALQAHGLYADGELVEGGEIKFGDASKTANEFAFADHCAGRVARKWFWVGHPDQGDNKTETTNQVWKDGKYVGDYTRPIFIIPFPKVLADEAAIAAALTTLLTECDKSVFPRFAKHVKSGCIGGQLNTMNEYDRSQALLAFQHDEDDFFRNHPFSSSWSLWHSNGGSYYFAHLSYSHGIPWLVEKRGEGLYFLGRKVCDRKLRDLVALPMFGGITYRQALEMLLGAITA